MKILETQSAVLTNYEVYIHLIEQKQRHLARGGKTRRPGNLELVVKELLEYFQEAPSPLASKPIPYDESTIRRLLEKLRQWDFTRAEIIMIMNLRPTKPETLNTVIEEMESRFPEEDTQFQICSSIVDVLGKAE
ncbi:RNA polymerase III subunit Rpc17 [Golovinomyces cichoracearum]|uniref:DNA-directed RNA polymerase III subunit RPC9 n=1 Tax=Golovinomyces cichoracearum TaxID=62708 RepID=A0A420IN21_9PEZI|nr:RNA polymerase III subunit Rpc17 [Golovinomyces cichoracearum]